MSELLPPNPAATLEYVALMEGWLRRETYYLHDHENSRIGKPVDDWRTLLPEILRRRDRGDLSQVGDDCDAWSMTAVDLGLWVGFPEEDFRLLLVHSWLGQILRPQDELDHMIGALRVEGRWYVIGDTERAGPYPASECSHKLWGAHRLPIGPNDFYRVAEWSDV